ncbi:hypothetical protein X777_11372 [Ooceraea biroi]|uniref:Uncharacterized protein n=1 Tax=Ooceraea biroi TaxID=2015173 RepID=A0A026W4B5_OOCBI|nr:hypothetical protein X777_11372 [Ooceraea biroi]
MGNSVFLVVGRAIIHRAIVRVMSIMSIGAEERPDGVELENDLFEPQLVR